MSAKCFLTRPHLSSNPKDALKIARDKLTELECDGSIRMIQGACVAGMKKVKVNLRERYQLEVYRSLGELGTIDLTSYYCGSMGNVHTCLCVSGTRNGILEMFRKADQNPLITVATPPGVFIGVFREEHWLSKDTIIIKIASGTSKKDARKPPDVNSRMGLKHGNYYLKMPLSKEWEWNWVDVTKLLKVGVTGTTTLHPRAFEGVLKDLFDNNKWW